MSTPADCLRTETGYWLATVKSVFEYILSGTPPWVAIGNFLDDWKYTANSDEQRHAMVVDSLPPAGSEPELQRWAAFCAAMVEVLCSEVGIEAPEWTARPEYRLAEPWYLYPGKHPELRAWQEETSPLPFKQRNIMAGDRSLNRA
jgi:hypothetical protein